MHNKKIIAKGLVFSTALVNTSIDSLANTIEGAKITNIENNTKENEGENGIKRFFAKIVEPIEELVTEPKEIIKVNKNIVRNSVLTIELSEDEFVPDLNGNPGGYETIKVTTEGGKKLVKQDYDNLRLSGIPKIDLSNAASDSIPEGAFKNASHLTEFKFPQGITTISNTTSYSTNGAFYKCTGLTGDLIIPDTVTDVGYNAFYGCTGFNGNLILSKSLVNICRDAFRDCSGLTGDLIIPDSVYKIGDASFSGCSGFNGSLVIPYGVTIIDMSAFSRCTGLTGNLVIPDSVTRIGQWAFSECKGFTGDLIIPDSVTRISTGVFNECTGFNGSLIIGKGITSIPATAFYGCRGLKGDLIIPDSVTSIYSENGGTNYSQPAFRGCTGLNGNLVIGSGLKEINQKTFGDCNFKGELIIKDGLEIIGEKAFYNKNFTGNLILPDSVTSIGNSAFSGCSGFNGNLVIPNSITNIGNSAFSGCSGFAGSIVIADTVTSVGTNAFYNTGFEKIIIKVDDGDTGSEYRKSVIENMPLDKTYVELSYNLDISGSWLETSDYIKAKAAISTYAGVFKNNEGMGISLEVLEASPIKTMTITKDGLNYDLEKSEGDKYIFYEEGDYQVYIETDLGTISNISFKNISPIKEPSINYVNNELEIIDNGTLKNEIKEDTNEEFDNLSDLKINFSNPNWIIAGGIFKSERIGHNSTTENEFAINAQKGEKLQINVKTSSESNYDWGYIYLNGTEVYKKSGTSTDFEVLELDLQEGENTIKFMYTKDSSSSTGQDCMSIDYIKILKKELLITDSDTLEYRINNGEWKTYNNSFELNYPVGTKVLVEVRAKHNGFTSTISSKEVVIEVNIRQIEEAIEKAEQSKDSQDISDARDLVNQMPESSKKDEFQDRLDAISPNSTLDRETVTTNLDIYIKSENMLSLSLDTNSVSFEEYSGAAPMEKLGAVNITINSSLPYNLNAYMPTEISNSDGSEVMPTDILNIRESNEGVYKQFENNDDKIILKENCQKGNDINHSIDLKLDSNDAHIADIYKTVIKFEAEQR